MGNKIIGLPVFDKEPKESVMDTKMISDLSTSYNILHNKKVLFRREQPAISDKPMYILEIYDYRLANRLNNYYKRYDNGGYKFKQGEEAIFHVAPNDVQFIRDSFLSKI